MTPPRRFFLLWLLLPVLLVGCTSPTKPAIQRLPQGEEAARREGGKASLLAAAMPKPPQMIGLDKTGVLSLLGAPHLIRRDGPAEVWQYAADACVLDLFLYAESGDYRVDYFELRPPPGETLPADACYAGIQRVK